MEIIKLKTIIWICLFIFHHPMHAFSEEPIAGEIININYQYELAFTELNDQDLDVGDVVKVSQGKELITYLQVIQTSKITSKLAPYQKNGKFGRSFGFQNITVGNGVVKIKDPVKEIKSAQFPLFKKLGQPSRLKNAPPPPTLKPQLTAGRKADLGGKNTCKTCEHKVKKLQDTLLSLKKKLENMSNIVEGNP